jgi:hypothetical protein
MRASVLAPGSMTCQARNLSSARLKSSAVATLRQKCNPSL